MASNSLSLLFTVNNIEVEEYFNCFMNVHKTEHLVSKRRYLDKNHMPLVHVAKEASRTSKEITYKNPITSRLQTLRTQFQSSKRSNQGVEDFFSIEGNNVGWDHNQVLLTNLTSNLGNPLFFGHRLPSNATSIEIISAEGALVNKNSYNIENEISAADQSLIYLTVCHSIEDLAYIKYNIGSTPYLKLLNKDKLFIETIEMVYGLSFSDTSTGKIFAFKIFEEIGICRFSLPLNTSVVYLKENEQLLRGGIAEEQFSNESWFFRTPRLSMRNNNNQYSVGEYYSHQSYDLGFPYKTIDSDFGRVISNNFIQVSNVGIQNSIGDTYIDLYLYKENENEPSLLITNNPEKNEIYERTLDLSWNYDKNLSVSALDRIVYSVFISEDYAFCKANYPIREEYYEYQDIDLNPFFNNSLLSKNILFYIVPESAGEEKSIHYLICSEDWQIEECSQPSLASWIGKPYKFTRSFTNFSIEQYQTNAMSIYFSIGESLEPTFKLNEYLILGHYKLDRSLFEKPKVIFTNLDENTISNFAELGAHRPDLLTIYDEPSSLFKDKVRWGLVELKNTKISRVHWTLLKDYVGSYGLYYKKELLDYIEKNIDLDIQPLIFEEGSPLIEIEEIDTSFSTIFIQWTPVLRGVNNLPIGGAIYTGTTPTAITTLVTEIPDLSIFNKYSISFSSDTLYIKVVPKVTINGSVVTGPSSNIIKISKEQN